MSQTNHGGARPGAGRPKGPRTDVSKRLAEAKTRKEESLASLRELELAKACGDVILAEAVRDRWVDIATTVRSRLLGIPSKCAAVCANRPTAEVEAILKAEIRHVLSELAETPDYGSA